MVNSLAQLLIKCTAPGVPDFYQGTELWDLSLVDPDNRRPVDYGIRASLLHQVTGEPPSPARARMLVDTRRDGRIKLFTIARALADHLFSHRFTAPQEHGHWPWVVNCAHIGACTSSAISADANCVLQ